jgi:UDP-2-acetamido-3-amino-2,3-dideoxy-glucuronate N-acetyltransferase
MPVARLYNEKVTVNPEPVDYRFTCLDTPQASGKIYLPSAIDPSVRIGAQSTIWRYTTILEGTVIGAECVIGSCVFIGRHCYIGDGTRMHPGAAIPDGTVIGQRVFVGASVTLTDVTMPNLRDKTQEVHRPPVIEHDVVLGSNCVVLPGILIGQGARVGAGAVVTRDVKTGQTVVGNPARIVFKSQWLGMAVNEAGEVLHG